MTSAGVAKRRDLKTHISETLFLHPFLKYYLVIQNGHAESAKNTYFAVYQGQKATRKAQLSLVLSMVFVLKLVSHSLAP